MAQPYWNAELETMPWAEMEAWQAQRIAEFVTLLPTRSVFYRKHLVLFRPTRFTMDHSRRSRRCLSPPRACCEKHSPNPGRGDHLVPIRQYR